VSKLKIWAPVLMVLFVLLAVSGCGLIFPEEYEVKFEVLDEQENELEQAQVELNGLKEKTDTEGVAHFSSVEEGTYSYEVSRDGYLRETGELVVDGDIYDYEVKLSQAEVFFLVKNLNIEPEEVDAGEEVTGEADIENLGFQEGTQEIQLYTAPEGEKLDLLDKEDLTLAAGEEDSISFSRKVPEEIEKGNHLMEIRSEDDAEAEMFIIFGEGNFEVSNLDIVPEEVEINEEVTVSADIRNTGEELARQDIELYAVPEGGEPIAPIMVEENFGLEVGEQGQVSFTEKVTEDEVEPGIYDVIVSSDDDQAEGQVKVSSSLVTEDPEPIEDNTQKLIFTLDIVGVDLEAFKEWELEVGYFDELEELHDKENFSEEDFSVKIEDNQGGAEADILSYRDKKYVIGIVEIGEDAINAGGHVEVTLDPHDENNQWQKSDSVGLEVERLDNNHTDEFEVTVDLD